MPVDISHLAYAARKASENGLPPLKHGHALELTAAALGYSSLAAYKAAVAAGDEVADLSEARHVVLQLQSALTRATELRPRAPSLTHLEWIRQAFAQCLPQTQQHLDEESVLSLLRKQVDHATVVDSSVSGEMAMSNCDDVREVYMPVHFSGEFAPVGEPHVLTIEGHVMMGVHEDKPPVGQRISVRATLQLRRLGRFVMAKPVFKIEEAKLIHGSANKDRRQPLVSPKVSLTQALAEELNVSIAEAELLEDFEPTELSGHSGNMLYGFAFDFSELGPSPLRDKLVARGQLIVQVGPLFFERVAR